MPDSTVPPFHGNISFNAQHSPMGAFWQTEGPSAYWACSDQFVSGVAAGSRYYPRIITTALWLTGRHARAAADAPLAADRRQG